MKHKFGTRLLAGLIAITAAGTAVLAQSPLDNWEPVTEERLLNPADGEWPHFRRDYASTGYSPLDQINRDNIADLELVWALSIGDDERWEPWPTVMNGVMFITEGRSRVNAIDAVTGEILWRYVRDRQDDIGLSQAVQRSRGVAFFEDLVLYPTADSHLVALDAQTGEVVWETATEDYRLGYGHTSPPLIVNGKAILGSTGGEAGGRGYIAALDARSGEMLWRTYTIPLPGEPNSETWETYPMCGAAWYVGSFDPVRNIYYMATGQPCPWSEVQRGTGGSLYANNILAMNPDTGEILWNFELAPHDNFDWDSPFESTLTEIDGRDVLINMSKTGWGVVLDRETGEFISAFQAGYNSALIGWTDDGQSIWDESKLPYPAEDYLDTGKVLEGVCPTVAGVRDAQATAYSPISGLHYTPAESACMDITFQTVDILPGERTSPIGAGFTPYLRPGTDYAGMFVAFDPATGEKAWEYRVPSGATFSGSALATAGGLVFSGSSDRWITAHNDETGEVLWQQRLNGDITGAPMTYEIDGRQYLAISAGQCGMQFCRDMRSLMPDVPLTEGTGVVWVFALPE